MKSALILRIEKLKKRISLHKDYSGIDVSMMLSMLIEPTTKAKDELDPQITKEQFAINLLDWLEASGLATLNYTAETSVGEYLIQLDLEKQLKLKK